jgi:hypothetical protein
MVYLWLGVKVLWFMHPKLDEEDKSNHLYSMILWRTLSSYLLNVVQLTVRVIGHGLPLSGSESAAIYAS